MTLDLMLFKAKRALIENKTLVLFGVMLIMLLFNANSFSATSVGDSLDNGAGQLLQEIARVYCGSVAYLLFAVEILIWLLVKNDKVSGIALKALIGCVIAYIVLKILSAAGGGVIGQTMDEVTDWVQ